MAGAEQNTSVAFGYAAESYVDFGLPLMFLPVLLWGIILGVGYQALLRLIYHRELAVAVVTVIFWLSLHLFERSWTKTFGTFATLMVYPRRGRYHLPIGYSCDFEAAREAAR